ncbi:hypothetical protein [Streptomyces sp. NPDC090025]|uniref:hypothetical protein n=1 Tax=Streptomyces sp. NPDC090025 TaxID=3365922 RepID=UPI00383428AE
MTRKIRALGAIAFAAAAALGAFAAHGEPTWDTPPANAVVAAPGEPTWDLPAQRSEPTWDLPARGGEPTWDFVAKRVTEPTWDTAPADTGA